MIKEFKEEQLDEVMKIWLQMNIKAHDFIDSKHWKDNFDMVKYVMPKSEIFVYEEDNIIKGFLGMYNDLYIAGIFILEEFQKQGIGKKFIDFMKEKSSHLELDVYAKNKKAINFYKKNNFIVESEKKDTENNEVEYVMIWDK